MRFACPPIELLEYKNSLFFSAVRLFPGGVHVIFLLHFYLHFNSRSLRGHSIESKKGFPEKKFSMVLRYECNRHFYTYI